MRDYHFHELADGEFQNVIAHLCVEVLGTGTVVFAEGKDGGKDGRFNGRANKFPSQTAPWEGRFIIQAKHVNSPIASCSDSEFDRLLDRELPKVKRLRMEGEVEYYLLFTNRKYSGGADSKIVKRITEETGVKGAGVFGKETITIHLDHNPDVAKVCGFDRFRGPLVIHPEELADIINAFRNNPSLMTDLSESKFCFKYTDLKEKNRLNEMGEEFFRYMRDNSEPYFEQIQRFLAHPINRDLTDAYYAIADEFRAKILIHRDEFGRFEGILGHLYDEILILVPSLNNPQHRRLINVFLHFMYFSCDIGTK